MAVCLTHSYELSVTSTGTASGYSAVGGVASFTSTADFFFAMAIPKKPTGCSPWALLYNCPQQGDWERLIHCTRGRCLWLNLPA